MLSAEDLSAEVQKIQWYHTIDLGNGMVTPGLDNTTERLEVLRIPADLGGLSVLDVGAWDGFFSFEAERRGAKRVLATDSFCWGGGGPGTKSGFELARRILSSRVEDMNINVLDLSPDKVGVFDLVLFLGVLYHMRDPLLALEHVYSVTGNQLILETHTDMSWTNRPAMAFYPGSELNRDPTNWWGPNAPAVEAMLKTAGFRKVEKIGQKRNRIQGLAAATYLKIRMGNSLFSTLQQNRMVFHAWR